MPYSPKFKARMIQRLTGPDAKSATSLSREVGLPQPTLSRWLRDARRLASMKNDGERESGPPTQPGSPRSWSATEKYRIVLEAASITDADLGAFLRSKGLHAAQLEQWRAAAAEGAMASLERGKKGHRPGGSKGEARRIRELERELGRKDKALAELAALLALKKKLDVLWGDEEGSTPQRNEP